MSMCLCWVVLCSQSVPLAAETQLLVICCDLKFDIILTKLTSATERAKRFQKIIGCYILVWDPLTVHWEQIRPEHVSSSDCLQTYTATAERELGAKHRKNKTTY